MILGWSFGGHADGPPRQSTLHLHRFRCPRRTQPNHCERMAPGRLKPEASTLSFRFKHDGLNHAQTSELGRHTPPGATASAKSQPSVATAEPPSILCIQSTMAEGFFNALLSLSTISSQRSTGCASHLGEPKAIRRIALAKSCDL